MVANRMNRDEFYATMAPSDEARLRKILWTLYWRGDTRLRERIADLRGERAQAAALITQCLKELPGHPAYLDFAVEIDAELPPRAREVLSERARFPVLPDHP